MTADEVQRAVAATGLLAGRVTVLYSGGRDSTCLLDLARRLAGPVTALHLNYGLRAAADADEAHCAAQCARLGIAFEPRRAVRPEGGNVQAWARDQRYAAAARLGGTVATGHTATDQVETVLYRLAASPGRRALLGMPARSGRLVRPLLAVSREDTAAYCSERGLAWREDASNPESKRGLIRETLLALHPAAEANILRTLELLREEAEALDAAVAGADVTTLPPALARVALQRMADRAAGGEAPAVTAHAEAILAVARHGGTASLDLPGGLRAVSEYGRLRIERARPAPPREPAPGGGEAAAGGGEAAPGGGEAAAGGGEAAAGGGEPAFAAASPAPARLPVPGRTSFGAGELVCERGPDLPIGDGTLAASALADTLEVRAWVPGDRMRPLGLGGSRSLQDLFTDRKVPRARRHALPVVLSDGEIAWIPGVATGERFRVTAATTERVRLAWSP